MAQNDQIYHFYLDFWVKNVLFKGQYLKMNLGNIPKKFYHDLYTPKIIENGFIFLGGVFYLGIDFGSTYCGVYFDGQH